MDPLRIVLGCTLILSVTVTSDPDLTSSATRSRDSGKSRRSGESRSYRWEGARNEDSTNDGLKKSKAKCVDIPQTMGLCRGIGYLKMRLPNLLEHETLMEVQQAAASWMPLLSTKCSSNSQLFLCSLFSPVCLDQPIWPCRSLCLEVKRGCEARMASHGFPWPEMLKCDKLPSDDDLCIGIQSNRSTVQESGVARGRGTSAQERSHPSCRICQNISSRLNNNMSSFCEAEFVARLKPEIAVITGNDLKLIPKRKAKFLKSPTSAVSHKRRQPFFVAGGAKCDCFDPSDAVHYLVTGRVTGKHRMVITSAAKFDINSKAWRKAVRVIKMCPRGRGKDQEVDNLNHKKGRSIEKKASKPGRKKKDRKSYVDSPKSGNRAISNGKKERRKKD